MYDGVPYVRTYPHPAFPRPDSTRSDTLLVRLQETWSDLEAILPESEERALHAIGDVGELEAWVAAFWRRRDPDPTTALNEFREQHEERLAYAREHYAAPEPPFYDDRGWAVLRFGIPDKVLGAGVSVDGGGYEPPIEVWRMGDMLFAFQSFTNNDVFRLSGMPENRSGLFSALAGGRRNALVMLERFEINEANDVILSEYEPAADEQLWLAASADCFRAPAEAGADRTLLRLHYQVRNTDLDITDRPGVGGHESVVKRAVALTEPGTREPRFRAESARAIPRSRFEEGVIYLAGVMEVVVEPGARDLTLHIEDAASGRTGLYKESIDVRRFPPDSLMMSDISLYNCGVPDQIGFDPGDKPGMPHPIAGYLPPMIPGFYFEVYGLAATPRGERRYALSYSIRENGKYLVNSWFEENTMEEVVRTSLVIDTRQLGPGDYVMEITVTDLVARPWDFDPGESQVVGRRGFRLVDPDAPSTRK